MKKTYVLIAILVLYSIIGCGVKGDPVPPHSSVPQAIEGLKVFSRDGQVVLQWAVPKKDTDGMELADLSGFRVWRRASPSSDDECPTCPKQFDNIADIDYLNLPAAQKKQRELTFWDDEDKKQERYLYTVSAYTVQGRESEKSDPVTVRWVGPPPSLQCLNAYPGDRNVALSWECDQPARSTSHTAAAKRFNVYRRTGSEIFPMTPINAEPVRDTGYRDLGVLNGEKYFYVVRPLQQSDDVLIEGGNSPEAAVVPEDRTPPAPPTITMAFQTAEGVTVVWEPSSESDLAGYYVYRRMVGTDAVVKISLLIKAGSRFIDADFTPGRVYYYSVTALDSATQQNESGFSQELRVETTKQ